MASTKKKASPKAKPAVKKNVRPTKPKSTRKPAPRPKAVKAPAKKKLTKPVAGSKAARKPVNKAASKAAPSAPLKKAAAAKTVSSTRKPEPVKPVKAAVTPPAEKATKAPSPAAPAKPAPAKDQKKPEASSKGKPVKTKEPIIAVMTGVEPIGGPARALKRAMKERFTLEFYLRATPGSLYDLISTPSGFSEWFCDDVDVRGDQYSFRWGADTQVADCLSRKFGELMRFQWQNDEDPGAYFEFRIRIDPMTNETCLVVTDHAWPKDLEEAKALWGSQIHTLQRVLGA